MAFEPHECVFIGKLKQGRGKNFRQVLKCMTYTGSPKEDPCQNCQRKRGEHTQQLPCTREDFSLSNRFQMISVGFRQK